MAEEVSYEVGIDRRLVRLASNPVGSKVLIVLNERAAGAGEIAEELGLSVATAAEQLEEMLGDGLIEIVEEPPGEGAAEPRYRALVRALWGDEEWSQLGGEERRRMSAWIVHLVSSDAAEALKAGSFDARPDTHASRTASLVDEQGWRELTRIQKEALEAIFAVQAASAERLAESGQEGVSALTALFCFEMPTRPS